MEMKEFADKFFSTKLQPQIFTILLVTLILVIFAIVIYIKTKKQKVNEAPSGLLLFTEQYVMGVDALFTDVTEGKFKKPAPYIFTLLTFLLLGNLMGLVGLEPPASSYSVTLMLALVSWIGIYVSGLMYQKLRFFRKFLVNPIDLIGQFSPLIAMSFRLFGNLIAGSVILYLIYAITGFVWGHIPVIGEFNLLGSVIAPVFHIYFDIFDGLIQAFVFTLLTMIYWTLEAETPEHKPKKVKNKKIRNALA